MKASDGNTPVHLLVGEKKLITLWLFSMEKYRFAVLTCTFDAYDLKFKKPSPHYLCKFSSYISSDLTGGWNVIFISLEIVHFCYAIFDVSLPVYTFLFIIHIWFSVFPIPCIYHLAFCLIWVQGSTSVQGYFPDATWYDGTDGSILQTSGGGGQMHMLQAPWDKIHFHFRGGYVIPTQQPDITTYQRWLVNHIIRSP